MPFCSGTHLGSTAAIAFAPSTPMSLALRLRLVSGALKNPTREKMRRGKISVKISASGHRMEERIGAFDSARRAASYLGSTAAMAFAPSTPILLRFRFRVVSGALKNPTRETRFTGKDALKSQLLGFGWRSGLEHSIARGELHLT